MQGLRGPEMDYGGTIVTTTGKDKRTRWLSFLVFLLVAFASSAYERQMRINKMNRMAAINAAHEARVAAMDASIFADKRFYLSDVRAAWRAHLVTTMAEINQTMSEIRAENGGKLERVNQTDYDAAKKMCDDVSALLDMFDKAEWVPGIDGAPVIKDGPLKERVRSESATIETDLSALNAADKAANDGYAKQQSEERK